MLSKRLVILRSEKEDYLKSELISQSDKQRKHERMRPFEEAAADIKQRLAQEVRDRKVEEFLDAKGVDAVIKTAPFNSKRNTAAVIWAAMDSRLMDYGLIKNGRIFTVFTGT